MQAQLLNESVCHTKTFDTVHCNDRNFIFKQSLKAYLEVALT